MTTAGDGTNATPEHMYGHVLHPEEFLARARYGSAPPSEELAPWVDRYWSVRWDLEEGTSYPVATLDDPCVHLTLERGDVLRRGADGGGTWITGPVTRGVFDVRLTGRGSVVGVRFRRGGTAAFRSEAVSTLRDRTVPAARWFTDPPFPDDLPEDVDAAAGALDAWLLALGPRDTPGLLTLRAVLDLLDDPAVISLAALQERTGMTARTLQRLLARHVGVGPKRMLVRARVMDALAAIDRGDPRPAATIAADLGWFDQSHFIRDVHAIKGLTPAAYAARRDAARGDAARRDTDRRDVAGSAPAARSSAGR
ncbi:DUF6597 domain-containing transcriptional factor [Brachybacterium rhamnosum]|uniref:DUF6597 domain-containing transcriptional factor n=1 Tax=Brachybacterium rhamnosum TaxID=173361 RepID=A0ABW4Q0Y0_9MICO